MIEFSGVTKLYDDDVVLKDITLSIEKGELAFITGPSGAGKTTLLKLIYAAEIPDKGQIVVAGWDISKLKQSTIPYLRRNVGIVFQDFRLLNNKTVFDNIALALRIHDMHPKEIRDDVNAILREVKLTHKAQIFPQHLSGGEQQRVVIARAMVSTLTRKLLIRSWGSSKRSTPWVLPCCWLHITPPSFRIPAAGSSILKSIASIGRI